MGDFVMRSKLITLHMWITSLEYTGTDPTLYIKSTLWYPFSLENSRGFISAYTTWSKMWFSSTYVVSFWKSECGHLKCCHCFSLLLLGGSRVLWGIKDQVLLFGKMSNLNHSALFQPDILIFTWSLKIVTFWTIIKFSS